MKVLIDIPDSVVSDLDRLRALVGSTDMTMTILRDDPARIIELFDITLDHGHLPKLLIARGVVVDENSDEVSEYVVIEPVWRNDESTRLKTHSTNWPADQPKSNPGADARKAVSDMGKLMGFPPESAS